MTDTVNSPSRAGRHFDIPKIAKDLVVTALIATAIFGSTIAFRTVSASGGLSLELRFAEAFYVIAAVVFGRLLLWIFFWSKAPGQPAVSVPTGLKQGFRAFGAKFGKVFGPAMLLLALVFPFLPTTDRYLLDLSILILTYIMLGWGLNIVVGLAGLLDLGYVAFYAIGAYSYALLAQYFGFSFWMCLPLAGILAAFWGIILGFPVLRLRGDYLAIVTLAFGEIIRVVLLNWYQFTGGPDGLSGIPRPSFFGIPFNRSEGGFADLFGLDYSSIHRIIFMYFLILVLALITNFVTNRLRRLPIGRAWEALREDEIACRSLGLNTTSVKLTAFAIGAMFAGFAGSFFATRQGFISPESFTFIESALILAIVVLGGMGSQVGVVIASIAMIGGFELFREAEQYRMLIFGLAMVVIMIWRPRGLISTRIPSIFLKERKAVSADMVAQGEGH
ncbi:MAG: branched-chain amino acid ABC transporter permease [Sneathiella sp.]|jgi:branched-chain amino acid transport system permease protein|uniref:high-affinity branched-chain amino acid ABC transporter permease LivM n=1 Tax=Sneathiella sp. TaxID=1964365 RepID=UPI000C46932F|nr:high-affinity branched-chain amino acid ABC transporter permease LivM [Sneathiella sp.]MAL78919.1 branched-chain amino acid ABC transporter permease [Sneathiella sp.]